MTLALAIALVLFALTLLATGYILGRAVGREQGAVDARRKVAAMRRREAGVR